MSGQTILSLHDVTVQFGGLKACDSVTVDVQRGELFALIGPNGAGKTTLVNAITGVYSPNEGSRVSYTDPDGTTHDLIGRKPHQIVRTGLARTFQNLGLFPGLSVLDNLMLGRYIHQKVGVMSGGLFTRGAVKEEVEAREAVERVLDLLEIPEYRWDAVGELPYGLQKRIELGRVLAMEPDLLLLDEPMAGMTTEEKQDVVRFIFEIRLALGVTVLLIEHDMAVVMSIADRVMALNFGQQIALGTPAEVQRNHDVIEAYLGAEG
ncbi:ABC transporter ATP-binding protein [Euzebya tangerina]|uniref:ABC transporter ATP-binding protein n=1 Tax=Euzebya tangerina TaxID=591198 RepID=UPI000E310CE5|nr:ABC transporter ATP-binding protein [Euzebya tangerina]